MTPLLFIKSLSSRSCFRDLSQAAATAIGMGRKDDKRVHAWLAWSLALLFGVTAPWAIEFLFTLMRGQTWVVSTGMGK